MDKKEKVAAMVAALKALGIKMTVGGCGCCGSPDVVFELGTIKVNEDNCSFSTEYEVE